MSFSHGRYFRVWDYNISHKQMLLRSPQSPDESENIDVVFWNVQYLEIPTALDGLTLTVAVEGEVERVVEILGRKPEHSSVHCLISGGRRFLVVAGGYKVLKNELDIFESSLEYFAATATDRDLGEVLSHS